MSLGREGATFNPDHPLSTAAAPTPSLILRNPMQIPSPHQIPKERLSDSNHQYRLFPGKTISHPSD